MVWTGSEFGVSWYDNRDGNYMIYFARIGADGAKIGSDVRVTYDSPECRSPSLTWTGSEFGVSWTDIKDDGDGLCDEFEGTMDCNYEIYFAQIGSTAPRSAATLASPTIRHQAQGLASPGPAASSG